MAFVLTLIVAALHFGFFVLESVLWTKRTGRRIFGLSAADAETTRVLAMNQGAYNGMLAIGLVWGALAGEASVVSFLLVFVLAMGIFGAATVKPTILLFQAVPAAAALAAQQLL